VLEPDWTICSYSWLRRFNCTQAGSIRTADEAPPLSSEVDQARVDAAVEGWRLSSASPGEGNERFFNFALDLRSAGMSLPDVEMMLRMEASYGRSPQKRKAQIPSIMSTLRSGRQS
jgi:hypothetical protein